MLKVQLKPFRGQIRFQENFNTARSIFYGLLKDSSFNSIHDDNNGKKPFSYTPIIGGRLASNGKLIFDNGGYWLFTCLDDDMMNFISSKIERDGRLGNMDVHKVIRLDENIRQYIVDGKNKFLCQYGFMACVNKDGKRTFYTYQQHGDELFDFLTRQAKKAILANRPNVDLSDFSIRPAQPFYRKKSMDIGGSTNLYNEKGHITVTGNKEAVTILHKIGIGNSTGCGFGLIQPVKP